MRIAVQILCFNVDKFLPHVVANCHPHVDKVYLAWSPHSWSYGPKKRKNPTDIYKYNLAAKYQKCEIVEGVWETEESMRNTCLERARAAGYDWMLIQDADEFFTDSGWSMAIKCLKETPSEVNLIKTTWYEFWKHPTIVTTNRSGGIKGNNAGFAQRITPDAKFIKGRCTNYSDHRQSMILDTPCYHYGWAISDDEMELKIQTWGHVNDFNLHQWFSIKWLRWSFETKNLNPIDPYSWKKAVFFPGEHPAFAQEIFGSSLYIEEKMLVPHFSTHQAIAETIYDSRAALIHLRKKFRNLRYAINPLVPISSLSLSSKKLISE
jgi:hypothetical protein